MREVVNSYCLNNEVDLNKINNISPPLHWDFFQSYPNILCSSKGYGKVSSLPDEYFLSTTQS